MIATTWRPMRTKVIVHFGISHFECRVLRFLLVLLLCELFVDVLYFILRGPK